MPQQGFHCIVDFEDVTFEACIECAATLGRCQLTASLLRGMADQARQRNVDDDARARAAARRRHACWSCRWSATWTTTSRTTERTRSACWKDPAILAPAAIPALSVTALTGCVRQAFLKTTEPYYQRPDQQYWSYRGTLGHLLAERGAGPDIVAERRFDRALLLPSGRRVTITGKPDEIDPARGLLIDYKTTDRAPRQLSPLHIAQLNVYRWLVCARVRDRAPGDRLPDDEGRAEGVRAAAGRRGRPSGSCGSAPAPWPMPTPAATGRP